MTRLNDVLVALAFERTGTWAGDWTRRKRNANRNETKIFCGLCDVLITTMRPEYASPNEIIREHGEQHRPAAQYVIDNDLHVIKTGAVDDLFGRSWGALIKGNLFRKIGVVQVCDVAVGPKWVADVMSGWTDAELRLRVIQWAARREDFRDALVAASELPDPDGVHMLVASQFWGDLQRKVAEDQEE